MKKRRALITVVCVVLALLMVMSVLLSVVSSISASAVSSTELNELKNDAEVLKEEKEALQAQIDALEAEQADALEVKAVLDAKVSVIEEEITNVTAQIAEYTELIAEKEIELKEAEEAEAEQLEQYKARIRAMEENSSISYISILFGAKSFSDLLTRIDFISSVMDYDKQLYEELQQKRKDVEEAKAELEEAKSEEETAQEELAEKKAELDQQVTEAGELVASLEDELGIVIDAYEENKERIDAIDAEIEALTKELEDKLGANSGVGSGGGGTNAGVSSVGRFLWPSVSQYVTSLYGTRFHPIYNVWRTHNGIDIGASYGTNIYAAENGRVILVAWDEYGYGRYVVISHDDGYTTLYAHMSKALVSVGDVVNQGDVIGLVGSTGASTGPHLHFEVALNGSRQDPLDYFTGYILC